MAEKRILVYDSVISPIVQRGVNRYFLKFLEALSAMYKDRVLFVSKQDLDLGNVNQLRPYSSRKYIKAFSRIRKAASIVDRLIVEQIANHGANLFYSPYFGSVKTKIPQVYTLPDMIYEKYPQYFDPALPTSQKFVAEKRSCLERAALILPISRSAGKDLQDIYPHISADRIKVVYLGADELFFEPHFFQNRQKPYFLFVGNRDRYKNFLRFLEAFGKAGLKKKFNLHIAIPFPNDFTADERQVIMRYDLVNYIKVQSAVSDVELKKMYAEAHAFVYPSEYEGFGLPIVEALASGTLVLTSNTSSLPEVGGSAPLYFDPLLIDSIADALQTASQMTDTERSERSRVGKSWAAQFTWENSQKSFLSAIQDFLKMV